MQDDQEEEERKWRMQQQQQRQSSIPSSVAGAAARGGRGRGGATAGVGRGGSASPSSSASAVASPMSGGGGAAARPVSGIGGFHSVQVPFDQSAKDLLSQYRSGSVNFVELVCVAHHHHPTTLSAQTTPPTVTTIESRRFNPNRFYWHIKENQRRLQGPSTWCHCIDCHWLLDCRCNLTHRAALLRLQASSKE
jgi:hypothetical protein